MFGLDQWLLVRRGIKKKPTFAYSLLSSLITKITEPYIFLLDPRTHSVRRRSEPEGRRKMLQLGRRGDGLLREGARGKKNRSTGLFFRQAIQE